MLTARNTLVGCLLPSGTDRVRPPGRCKHPLHVWPMRVNESSSPLMRGNWRPDVALCPRLPCRWVERVETLPGGGSRLGPLSRSRSEHCCLSPSLSPRRWSACVSSRTAGVASAPPPVPPPRTAGSAAGPPCRGRVRSPRGWDSINVMQLAGDRRGGPVLLLCGFAPCPSAFQPLVTLSPEPCTASEGGGLWGLGGLPITLTASGSVSTPALSFC